MASSIFVDPGRTNDGGITQLTGDVSAGPGDGSQVASISSNLKTAQLTFIISGGGVAITTGAKKTYITCPVTGTITGWRLLGDQSGSIVVDVWKAAYASYPPTVSNTITASAKPTISSATKNESTTLTGWTTSVTAGDVFETNVDSITTIQLAYLTLTISLT